MVWAFVVALLLVLVGLPLVLSAVTSRGFWLAVFLCACAGVLVYSCNHDTTPPRARKVPRAAPAAPISAP